MTVRLLADEHIVRRLVVGLRHVVSEADVVHVQDVGLRTVDDRAILQWAADEGRALVTQDIRTMTRLCARAPRQGLSTPGVFVFPTTMSIGTAIGELALIVRASDPGEMG